MKRHSLFSFLAPSSGLSDEQRSRVKAAKTWAKCNPRSSAIHFLVREGAEVELAYYLQRSPHSDNVNLLDEDGQTPLQLAARLGHSCTCYTLLKSGADIDRRSPKYPAPLQLAAIAGHVDTVRALQGAGASVVGRNGEPSALLSAALAGNAEIVKILYIDGLEAFAADEYDSGPLLFQVLDHDPSHPIAALLNASELPNSLKHLVKNFSDGDHHVAIFHRLFDLGVRYGVPDEDGSTVVDHLLNSVPVSTKLLELLLDTGLNPSGKTSQGSSILSSMIGQWLRGVDETDSENLANCIKVLLDRGASVYSLDELGNSTLYQAITADCSTSRRREVIELLINSGASLNSKCHGFSALHQAAIAFRSASAATNSDSSKSRSIDLPTLTWIVSQRYDLTLADGNGGVIFAELCAGGAFPAAAVVFERGASPYAKSQDGYSVWRATAMHQNMNMVHLLMCRYGFSLLEKEPDHSWKLLLLKEIAEGKKGAMPMLSAIMQYLDIKNHKSFVDGLLVTALENSPRLQQYFKLIHYLVVDCEADPSARTPPGMNAMDRLSRNLALDCDVVALWSEQYKKDNIIGTFDLFIRYGAAVSDAHQRGGALTVQAAALNSVTLLDFLREQGAPSWFDLGGSCIATVELEAVRCGYVDIVKHLIGWGLRFEDTAHGTPFTESVEHGKVNTVRLLLENKIVDINQNRKGITPILLAAKSGNEKMIALLLEHGAVANISEKTQKNNPIHLYLGQQKRPLTLTAIQLFIDHGVPVNEKNAFGKTPLDVLAEWADLQKNDYPSWDLIDYLVDKLDAKAPNTSNSLLESPKKKERREEEARERQREREGEALERQRKLESEARMRQEQREREIERLNFQHERDIIVNTTVRRTGREPRFVMAKPHMTEPWEQYAIVVLNGSGGWQAQFASEYSRNSWVPARRNFDQWTGYYWVISINGRNRFYEESGAKGFIDGM